MDLNCRRCGEPWEYYYLRHDGLWDHPGRNAPPAVIEAHEALVAEDDRLYLAAVNALDTTARVNARSGVGYKVDYEKPRHGDQLYHAVASGEGCPSCWENPDRIPTNKAEQEQVAIEALYTLFEGTDDDPAMFL